MIPQVSSIIVRYHASTYVHTMTSMKRIFLQSNIIFRSSGITVLPGEGLVNLETRYVSVTSISQKHTKRRVYYLNDTNWISKFRGKTLRRWVGGSQWLNFARNVEFCSYRSGSEWSYGVVSYTHYSFSCSSSSKRINLFNQSELITLIDFTIFGPPFFYTWKFVPLSNSVLRRWRRMRTNKWTIYRKSWLKWLFWPVLQMSFCFVHFLSPWVLKHCNFSEFSWSDLECLSASTWVYVYF